MVANRYWRHSGERLDMAAFDRYSIIADGDSLRLGDSEDAAEGHPREGVCLANNLVRFGLDFAGHRARFATARTGRAIILGAHDTA